MEFKEYLTMAQAAVAVGCSRRTLYRIVERVGVDDVVTIAFGKQLIHRSKLQLLKKEYMPIGSEKRTKAAVAWGEKGGTQKSVNHKTAAKNRKMAWMRLQPRAKKS
jgi:hypothetical protein